MAKLKRIPIPFARRMETFQRQVLPLLVWLLAIAGVVYLLEQEEGRFHFVGLAESQEFVVASPQDGMLQELFVELYQEVEEGELLAAMDSRILTADLDVANAEVARLDAEKQSLRAELESESRELARDWEKDYRRFVMDGVGLQVDILQARVEVETDMVEAERLRIAAERAASLLEANAGSAADAEDLALAREVVLARVATNRDLLGELETQFASAQQRTSGFATTEPDITSFAPRLEALRQAIVVQELRLRSLEIQREHMVMRAPTRGVIASLAASKGRSLVLGQEILRILPHQSDVVFFQPQLAAAAIQAGAKVEVTRMGSSQVVEAVVTDVAPQVETIPASLWRDPAVAEYGRATRLSPTPSLHLVPGNPVQIRFLAD